MQLPRNRAIAIVAALALIAGLGLWLAGGGSGAPVAQPAQANQPALGLMTTLPIYWPEADSPQELLSTDVPQHWARIALERRYDLRPLDTLEEGGGLDDIRMLLLVQPRALAPQENVALDDWVRIQPAIIATTTNISIRVNPTLTFMHTPP